MKPRARHSDRIKKRRTTLTLPVESLAKAERMARARNVNLSTVIAEAISEGLQIHAAAERSEEVLGAYRKAFSGFNEEEMSLLDGIILERTPRR